MLLVLLNACSGVSVRDSAPAEEVAESSGGAGTIVLEGFEDFGVVQGIAWAGRTEVAEVWIFEPGGALYLAGSAVLAAQVTWFASGVSCADEQARWTRREEVTSAIIEASDSGADSDSVCGSMPEFFEVLSLGWSTKPEATMAWAAGDEDTLLPGSYALQGEDPYIQFNMSFTSEGAPSYAEDWSVEDCGLRGEALDGRERVSSESGRLDVEAWGTGEHVAGSLYAELEGEEGEAGWVQATFDAPWCERPNIGRMIIF